jgi:hypothetical protein
MLIEKGFQLAASHRRGETIPRVPDAAETMNGVRREEQSALRVLGDIRQLSGGRRVFCTDRRRHNPWSRASHAPA